MPPDDSSARTEERCASHPHRVSVAHCDRCGRALCIACAVPVRWAVFGAECLTEVLGDDVPAHSGSSVRPAPSTWVIVVTAAFAVAVAGTALPWTRFQEGSGPFGAWGLSPRWSMLVALASVGGLTTCILAWRGRAGAVLPAIRAAATLVVVGAILAIARPPSFAPPWLGPWISLAGGAVASGISIGALRPVRARSEAEPRHARAS